MKYAIMSLFALSLLVAAPTFATQDCTCTKQCQEECSKNKSKTCDCKACDCKSEKCTHGKCDKKK